MRNLKTLSPNEASNNTTIRKSANLTPFEQAEIQAMQAKIYGNDNADFDWDNDMEGYYREN